MRIGDWYFNRYTNKIQLDQIAAEILDFTSEPMDSNGIRHVDPNLIFINLVEEDRASFILPMQKTEEIRNFSIQVHYQSPKGQLKSIRITRVENPDILGDSKSLGYVYDRSDLEKAKTDLEERNYVLDSMFEVLPDLFFKFNEELNIIDYRAQKDSMLYVEPIAFLNKNLGEILPQEVCVLLEKATEDARETGRVSIFNYQLPIGQQLYSYECRVFYLPQPKEFISFVRDITGDLITQNKLETSEKRFRTLLENTPFPIIISRIRDGVLVFGNKTAKKRLNFDNDQGIGIPAVNFYKNENDRDAFVGEIRKNGSVIDFEIELFDFNL